MPHVTLLVHRHVHSQAKHFVQILHVARPCLLPHRPSTHDPCNCHRRTLSTPILGPQGTPTINYLVHTQRAPPAYSAGWSREGGYTASISRHTRRSRSCIPHTIPYLADPLPVFFHKHHMHACTCMRARNAAPAFARISHATSHMHPKRWQPFNLHALDAPNTRCSPWTLSAQHPRWLNYTSGVS